MNKGPEEIGVGQLAFTFTLRSERKDETRETEDNGSAPSISAAGAKSETARKRKWHSLIDKVYALPNLTKAWRRVKANRGAAGVDGMTVKAFGQGAEQRLQALHDDLARKTYRPKPVRRAEIPKAGGGKRPLGIPTVTDRIVQQALVQILGPIFDPKFSRRSHGYRPERGCATALSVVDHAVRYGYEWVVEADIRSFFDTVDHEHLLDAVNEEVADGSVLKLIRRFLKSGVYLPETADVEPTDLGTPQGGPLSPLLANIYLHAFDVRMEAAGYGLVRYADDFVLFTKSESEAQAALEAARAMLEGELRLQLHPEKTGVVSVATGFEFLGYHYFWDVKANQMRKEVRAKSVRRFRDKVRSLTPRLHNQRRFRLRRLRRQRFAKNPRVMGIIEDLNRYLQGWHWYFKAVWSPYDTPFRDFDGFVRRRVRAAITGRLGRGNLHRLLPNALLAAIGLLSLDGLQRQYLQTRLVAPAQKGKPGGEPYTGKPYVRFGKEGGSATAP
jgi:RNA-directed DNA polymerase